METWQAGIIISFFCAVSAFCFWHLGKRSGMKHREKEVVQDYFEYIPLGEIGEIAAGLMEKKGKPENYPIMVVMPTKYDYLDGSNYD